MKGISKLIQKQIKQIKREIRDDLENHIKYSKPIRIYITDRQLEKIYRDQSIKR